MTVYENRLPIAEARLNELIEKLGLLPLDEFVTDRLFQVAEDLISKADIKPKHVGDDTITSFAIKAILTPPTQMGRTTLMAILAVDAVFRGATRITIEARSVRIAQTVVDMALGFAKKLFIPVKSGQIVATSPYSQMPRNTFGNYACSFPISKEKIYFEGLKEPVDFI